MILNKVIYTIKMTHSCKGEPGVAGLHINRIGFLLWLWLLINLIQMNLLMGLTILLFNNLNIFLLLLIITLQINILLMGLQLLQRFLQLDLAFLLLINQVLLDLLALLDEAMDH